MVRMFQVQTFAALDSTKGNHDFLLRDEKITQTDDFDYLYWEKIALKKKKNIVEKFVYANFSYSTIKYSDEKWSDH